MNTSRFWQFVQSLGRGVAVYGFRDREQHDQASEAVFEELPEARQWERWEDDCGSIYYFRHPIVYLLLALKWGEDGRQKSPKPMEYSPKNFTLHFGPESFEAMLYQHPTRGTVPFFWWIYDDHAYLITQPSHEKRLFNSILAQLYDPHDDDPWHSIEGAAIGFIHCERVDVYPFPNNWIEVIERVRDTITHMTAREKAQVELRHELRAFVELLGWDTVNAALQGLKP